MRQVRISRTFLDQLVELLEFGGRQFGERIADEKRALVFAAIRSQLALFPGAKRPHPALGLVAYPISGTPFIVLYDHDDEEVRIHLIVHARASLEELDPASVDW